MIIFWGAAPYSLIEIDWRFRGAYNLHRRPDRDSTSEASINIYETRQHKSTKDGHIHTRRRENLKSHRM
jgi:hypothetical protein